MTKPYEDRFWTSPDGLSLHYRDYAGPSGRPALLCIPGLTRNARDFEPLANHFAGDWRVICVDLRGRGESEYARDAESYTPQTYLDDLGSLIEQAGLDRMVVIGTSLGGLLAMLMAPAQGHRMAGAVLNDIGPVLEQAGLDAVRESVGRGATFPTWMHAARSLQESHGKAFPAYGVSDWLEHAKRRMELSSSGRISFAYDMKIAQAFQNAPDGEVLDLWPFFERLGQRPLLAVRGELSDLLSASTLQEMERRAPGMAAITIAQAGHAPSLAEPEALAAIARLLEKIG